MRKITSAAVHAFNNQQNFKLGNTTVTHDNGVTKLLLHNHIIAESDGNYLSIDSCGWKSATTKERLNGLPNINIRQVAGEWMLNGTYWNGQKTTMAAL